METYESKVAREGLGFGEGPRWHDGRLWFSDFYRNAIFSIDENCGDERLEHNVANQPSGLGWLPNGDLLYVSMTDRKVMRLSNGVATEFADISEHCGFWANDMLVSPSGFSYVGNFGFDLHGWIEEKGAAEVLFNPLPSTNVVVLNPEGKIIQVVPDLFFPNGTVLSADNTTLMVGETFGRSITAFDVADDGTLSNRRVWADVTGMNPDGSCIDDEGQIWTANPNPSDHGIVRVKEGGEITARVNTTEMTFACAMGGADLKTLFIFTAPDSSPSVLKGNRLGKIETVRVPVGGQKR